MHYNIKKILDKKKQWSVEYRGCTYFINQINVTKKPFIQLLLINMVCKLGYVNMGRIITDSISLKY